MGTVRAFCPASTRALCRLPLNPHFSPFAAIRLRVTSSPCYHWPMSHRQLISLASRHSLLQTCASKFPKWNKLEIRLGSTSLPESGGACFTLLTRDCPSPATLSKRATRKLENYPSHSYSGTSKFLIDNFQRDLSSECFRHARINRRRCISNRQTYEKLEVDVSYLESITSLFLIDTKSHFIQGELDYSNKGGNSRPAG